MLRTLPVAWHKACFGLAHCCRHHACIMSPRVYNIDQRAVREARYNSSLRRCLAWWSDFLADAEQRAFDPADFLAKAGGGRSISGYIKNQTVFSQGDPADAVFYIAGGEVKITVISEHGKEAVVAILGKDEFFGEGCLAGQTRRIATARTMTACQIMRIDKESIIRTLHEQPAFSEVFIAHLLARTIRVEADLVDQLFNSSEKRLARALLLLANFGKEGRPEAIITKVSQETLADMIGTTRSRVSFFMNKFRKLGFISYNGTIEVHSSLLSVVLHDQPQIRKRTGASREP